MEILKQASRALIKLQCGGLDENHISFDQNDFQKQVIEREGVDKTDEIYFTHPLSPLRVSAILDFWKSEAMSLINKIPKKDLITNDEVDKNISKVLEKMNPEVKTKQEVKNKENFVLYAAYYVLVQDNISDETMQLKMVVPEDKDNAIKQGAIDISDSAYLSELNSLRDICGSEEVDLFIKEIACKLNMVEFTEKIKELSMEFKKSKKGIKCGALEKTITVARADGELSSNEKNALYFVTTLIGIKKDFVDQILKFLD